MVRQCFIVVLLIFSRGTVVEQLIWAVASSVLIREMGETRETRKTREIFLIPDSQFSNNKQQTTNDK